MPLLQLPIGDIHQSVERPVVMGVVRDLMDILRISADTPVNYYGIDGTYMQPGSTLGSMGMPTNIYGHDERVFLDIEEQSDPAFRWAYAHAQRNDVPPTFFDEKLGISIRPKYSVQKIRVSLKYRAIDKNEAIMWKNMIRSRLGVNLDILLHEIEYGYSIPPTMLELLKYLYSLRENQAGYNESWDEYFTGHLIQNCSLFTNANGTSESWVVAEKQQRVQGYTDIENEPEVGSKEEHDTWVVGFSYTFQYSKPIEMSIQYPIVIHNQLIDEKYRASETEYRLEDTRRFFSLSNYALEHFNSDQRSLAIKQAMGVKLPLYDEWFIPVRANSLINLFSVVCQVDPDHPRVLFNLAEDMQDYSLDLDIVDFLKKIERLYINKLYSSIIQINLYEDDFLVFNEQILIDANLNLSTNFDMSLRKTYRVVFSIVSDFTFLSTKTIARLQNNPKAAIKIANHINALLPFLSARPDINKTSLTADDYTLITGKKFAPSYGKNEKINWGEMVVAPQYAGLNYATTSK